MNVHYSYSPRREAETERFNNRMTVGVSVVTFAAFAYSFCQWWFQW